MTKVTAWLTCGDGLPRCHFQESLLVSVFLGLRCVATRLSNIPNVIQCIFFPRDDRKEDTNTRIVFAEHTSFSIERLSGFKTSHLIEKK